jgi:hypothetical protein
VSGFRGSDLTDYLKPTLAGNVCLDHFYLAVFPHLPAETGHLKPETYCPSPIKYPQVPESP